jgi:hypothetical protein
MVLLAAQAIFEKNRNIRSRMQKLGGSGMAAQLCTILRVGHCGNDRQMEVLYIWIVPHLAVASLIS